MFRTVLIAAMGLGLAACASTSSQTTGAAPEGRDCFRNNDITGFSVTGERTMRLDVSTRGRYQLTTATSLLGARQALQIAVESGPGFICEGDALNVRLIAPGPPRQFWNVVRIERLPDEAPVEGS